MAREPLISDDELAELAMAADPDAPIADDAVPFDDGRGDRVELLPAWYMPAPSSGSVTWKHRVAATVCIGSLLAVSGAGLCVTYGVPELPLW